MLTVNETVSNDLMSIYLNRIIGEKLSTKETIEDIIKDCRGYADDISCKVSEYDQIAYLK